MTTKIKLGLVYLLLACAVIDAQTKLPSLPHLREELLAMAKEDQAARAAVAGMSMEDQLRNQAPIKRIMSLDRENTQRLHTIVVAHGWPTISMVGDDGAHAAWLLAQHADADREFQKHVLALMEKLLPSREVRASDVAYLRDRVTQPQRYGTQGRCVGPGKWEPNELEDSAKVDQLREEAGIQPPRLSDYIALMNQQCE
jgi:hypothetical protein